MDRTDTICLVKFAALSALIIEVEKGEENQTNSKSERKRNTKTCKEKMRNMHVCIITHFMERDKQTQRNRHIDTQTEKHRRREIDTDTQRPKKHKHRPRE